MLGGNPADTSGSTSLLYAGEQFDTDLQQYYLRARFYDPLNGRFNRLDPFAGSPHDPQSLHKYLYCHANPVNNIDLLGLFTISNVSVSIAIISSISGLVSGTIGGIKGAIKGGLSGAAKGFLGGFTGGFISTFFSLYLITVLVPSAGPFGCGLAFGFGGMFGSMAQNLIENGFSGFWTAESIIQYGVAFVTGCLLGYVGGDSVRYLANQLADKLDDLGFQLTSSTIIEAFKAIKNMSLNKIIKIVGKTVSDIWYFYRKEVIYFTKEILKENWQGAAASLTLVPMAEAISYGVYKFLDNIKEFKQREVDFDII